MKPIFLILFIFLDQTTDASFDIRLSLKNIYHRIASKATSAFNFIKLLPHYFLKIKIPRKQTVTPRLTPELSQNRTSTELIPFSLEWEQEVLNHTIAEAKKIKWLQKTIIPKWEKEYLEAVNKLHPLFNRAIPENISNQIKKQQEELLKLLQNTKNLPEHEKILYAWKNLLAKKWNRLAGKYETYIGLLYQGSISETEVHNKLKIKNDILIQDYIQKPLKQYKKKGVYLFDLLQPLDEHLKQELLNNGIEKEYLDFIYLTNRANIDSNILSLISHKSPAGFYDLILEHNDYYKQNKIIIIEKDFIQYLSTIELIMVINHEIQHTFQHTLDKQKLILTKELILEEKGYKPFPISRKFKEFDADAIGILKTGKKNIETAIEALPILKIFAHNYPDLNYPTSRYEYSIEIIKSMITGILPQEIPDAWLDDTEQILDQEIKRLQFQKQKATIPQIPRAKM